MRTSAAVSATRNVEPFGADYLLPRQCLANASATDAVRTNRLILTHAERAYLFWLNVAPAYHAPGATGRIVTVIHAAVTYTYTQQLVGLTGAIASGIPASGHASHHARGNETLNVSAWRCQYLSRLLIDQRCDGLRGL